MTDTDMIIAAELVLLIAIQVGDGITTLVALRSAALAEGNPIAAAMMSKIGKAPTVFAFKLMAVAFAIGFAWSRASNPITGIAFLTLANALCGWVVIDNARLIWRAKAGERGSAK